MDYIFQHLWTIWAVVAMLCLILELSSGDFYVTCFGIGALCALVAALAGVPLWAQVAVFAVFSVVSVYFLRPRLVALLNRSASHRVSNADAIIDRIGTVSETIPVGGYGRVKIDGDDWKAQSDETDPIEKGMKVRVLSRDSIIISVASVD